jgi:hypothetical protein
MCEVKWMSGVCGRHGRDEKRIKMLTKKSEEKRRFGGLKRRWEDDIRMNLREVGWKVVDWFHLA